MGKTMTSRLGAAALGLLLALPAFAQVSLQTTPPPAATAENEAWYLNGGPVTFAGSVYYPAGPVTHFARNEMVRTGTLGTTPVYARTTQEPGSIIYVPLAGGLMRPYERRRSGDLAGTVGSSAPTFRVVLPSEESTGAAQTSLTPVGTSGYMVPRAVETPVPPPAVSGPTPVGTTGMTAAPAARSVRTRVQTAQRPVGLNTVFIDFQNARWFAAGPTVEFAADRFTRIGEHRGFGVYQQAGRTGTIYLSLLEGTPGLLAPYKSR